MIPIYKPYLPSHSLRHAHAAIDSTWISFNGPYVERATEKLRELLGVKYVQLVNNGTAATHLVAKGLFYKHPNITKVIVPNNVYVAAWNAFVYDKNFDLVPIDADVATWNMNIEAASHLLDDNNTALYAVHNLGNTINIPALKRRFGKCVFVEDNCEGFMGTYEGKYSGTESLASSVSFFGNKTITSGEGGAVITNDEDVFKHVKSVHGQGQAPTKKYIHDRLGHNYRMTNVQAAILLGQLEILPEILEKKKNIFDFYKKEFALMRNVEVQQVEEGCTPSNWMMGVRLRSRGGYASLQNFLADKGIDSRPMFYPMSSHSHLKHVASPTREKGAKILHKEGAILPSFPELTHNELVHIVASIEEYANK